MTDYKIMNAQLDSLVSDCPHPIANMANASALIWDSMEDINWAGFYTVEDGRLVLGPFQGKPACIEIPMGSGVCGTAVSENRTLVVENVHEFPGHIACDCASNSEIVVPLRKDGRVIGVLDIDSPVFARFTDEDKAGLEEFARILENSI